MPRTCESRRPRQLYCRPSRAVRTESIRYGGNGHLSPLDCRGAARQLQNQQLHRINGRRPHCDRNGYFVRYNGSLAQVRAHFYGAGDRRPRHLPDKPGAERQNVRARNRFLRIKIRQRFERRNCLRPVADHFPRSLQGHSGRHGLCRRRDVQ